MKQVKPCTNLTPGKLYSVVRLPSTNRKFSNINELVGVDHFTQEFVDISPGDILMFITTVGPSSDACAAVNLFLFQNKLVQVGAYILRNGYWLEVLNSEEEWEEVQNAHE